MNHRKPGRPKGAKNKPKIGMIRLDTEQFRRFVTVEFLDMNVYLEYVKYMRGRPNVCFADHLAWIKDTYHLVQRKSHGAA